MFASIVLATALQQSPRGHVVVTGDTLSGIAAAAGDSLPALEAANPQIANPDLIYPGQVVNMPGGGAPVTAGRTLAAHQAAAGKAWGVTYGYPNRCGDGDGDGWDVPCGHRAASPSGRFSSVAVAASVSAAPGSFQACVIARESGGNPRAVNASSGAGGLYQFLPSTWRSLGYGGLPEYASVATQNQAFQRLYATAGTSPWRPYDGCL